MPKYSYRTEKIKAKRVSKSLIEHDLNASAVARQRGTTPQNEAKKARSKPVQDCLAKFLDSTKLKKKLVEIGLEGLKAEKPINADILVDSEGEVKKSEDKGAISVKDHSVRHKYWHDLMIASGGIKLDKTSQGITIVTVVYGYRKNND